MTVNWFAILLVIISFGIIVQMLRKFPSKETPSYVYLMVFIGWFLPFVTIVLVPYDVYVSLSDDGPKDLLYACWDTLYWIIFSFCWLVLPLLKRYMLAGEFTILTKIGRAVINQLRYFTVLVFILLIFIIYLAAVGNLTKSSLQEILAALGSLWGMLLIIILMGYGVVAIPKMWWYKGDLEKSLNYIRLKVVKIDEQRIEAGYDLDQCLLKVIICEKKTSGDIRLYNLVTKIIDICPQEELEVNRSRTYNLPEVDTVDYKSLVQLHTDVKNIKLEKTRIEW